jgi:uncharacterized paraquat-inducible protein A
MSGEGRARPRELGFELYTSPLWRNLSNYVRFERAQGYCEECGAAHGTITEDWRSVVVLQCAHVNGDRSDLRQENLRALCRRCHARLDARRRAECQAARQARLVAAARRVVKRYGNGKG